jgi:hypothetical protein
MEREVKGSGKDAGGEEAICSEVGVGEQFVNGRSAVPVFSCMQSMPRTANRPTLQPPGREQPVDSHCMQSRSERVRDERRHAVKCEFIVSSRVTSEEPRKENKDLFYRAYAVRSCMVKRSWSWRRATWNEFGVDNQSFQ